MRESGGCGGLLAREGQEAHVMRAEGTRARRGCLGRVRGRAGRQGGARGVLNTFGFGGGRVMSGLRIRGFHMTTRQT